MKKRMNMFSGRLCTAAIATSVAFLVTPVLAHEYKVGELEIIHPFAAPTPPGMSVAAGYIEVINHGDEDDRLVGGSVNFAHDVQIHETTVENDVSKMRELTDGLVIPAGTTVKLEPMERHLMFTELAEPLVEGTKHTAKLHFEKSGEVEVVFNIEFPGNDSGHAMSMEGMKHEMPMEGMDHEMPMDSEKVESLEMEGVQTQKEAM